MYLAIFGNLSIVTFLPKTRLNYFVLILQFALLILPLNKTLNLFTEDLKALIKETVKEAVNKALKDTAQRFEELNATIAIFRVDLDSRTKFMAALSDENKKLNDRVQEKVENQHGILEQYSKRDNLLFMGPLVTAADVANANGMAENSNLLSESVVKIIKNILDVKISPSNISVTHRILKPVNCTSTSPAPVIVRFTRRSICDYVFHSRIKLKGVDIGFSQYINEDLTAINQKIFNIVQQKYRNNKVKASGQPTAKFCGKPEQPNTVDS